MISTVHRSQAGVWIAGPGYRLILQPCGGWQVQGDPSVYVDVLVVTGDEDTGSAQRSQRGRSFARREIELDGDELRCLRAAPQLGGLALREGFVLTLVPGMVAVVEAQLDHMDRLTREAAALVSTLRPFLRRRLWPHEDAALLEAVAYRQRFPTLEDALHQVVDSAGVPCFGERGDAHYAELNAALRAPAVRGAWTPAAFSTPAAAYA
ncbi:hypothetical protein [Ralstonia pseudosolanacearum]|uniref:hypothetical protein n=1 Tax=Ralstonia pseudosolanacearum TaxID=1310165 RepID=UPI00115FA99D|nr:hypothetical protein [Ralstonia pseudosolanacearum]MCL1622594.1 hypothetical protein [Ralstonia pseudosolanacearum CaRs-Mep]